jgi:hypothetical protein
LLETMHMKLQDTLNRCRSTATTKIVRDRNSQSSQSHGQIAVRA